MDHDGARLDLGSFAVLKYLTATALRFISSFPSGILRDGLYKLLPRSLERMQVVFSADPVNVWRQVMF
jgi:hypothetical protein